MDIAIYFNIIYPNKYIQINLYSGSIFRQYIPLFECSCSGSLVRPRIEPSHGFDPGSNPGQSV